MSDDIELGPSADEVRKHAKKLHSEREYNLRYNRQNFDKLSPKQNEYMNSSADISELRLQAASQSGKTFVAMRAQSRNSRGDYLPSYTGKRFFYKQSISRPHEYMSRVISSSNQTQKSTVQPSLLGNLDEPGGLGSGAIPLHDIIGRPIMMPGMAGVVQSVVVRRTTGGTGMISFNSMEQDIAAFAGVSLDEFYWDEPGPIEKYLECLARLTAVVGSRATYSATPTAGRDALFQRFEEPSPTRRTIHMSLYDAIHMSPEQIAEVVERTPIVDRPMRIFGLPAQGSGSVYAEPENNIVHDRALSEFDQPWIKWAWALDICHGGSASAFAAVLFAVDSQTDKIWIVDIIKLYNTLLPQQVATIKAHPFGDCLVLYPKDSSQPGNAVTGETLAAQMKKLGLNMAPSWAKNSRGVAPSLDDGVSEVRMRLETGRLRVARGCAAWFDELRAYHKKDGRIVAEFCDLLDATRIACIGYKSARSLDNRNQQMVSGQQQQARGVDDWNVFTGEANGTDLDDVVDAAIKQRK